MLGGTIWGKGTLTVQGRLGVGGGIINPSHPVSLNGLEDRLPLLLQGQELEGSFVPHVGEGSCPVLFLPVARTNVVF